MKHRILSCCCSLLGLLFSISAGEAAVLRVADGMQVFGPQPQFYDGIQIGRQPGDTNSQGQGPYTINVTDDGGTATASHTLWRHTGVYKWQAQFGERVLTGLSETIWPWGGVSYLELWNPGWSNVSAFQVVTEGVAAGQAPIAGNSDWSWDIPFQTTLWLRNVQTGVTAVQLGTSQNNFLLNNTGIGTNSPTDKLHVVGSSRLEGNTTVTGNLSISGPLSLGNGLNVGGETTLGGTVNFQGAINAVAADFTSTVTANRGIIGNSNTNWSVNGLVSGSLNEALGNYNFATGNWNLVNGTANGLIGTQNSVLGGAEHNFAAGLGNQIGGWANASAAVGNGNYVYDWSRTVILLGGSNRAGGNGQVAIGTGLFNDSYRSVVVGMNNNEYYQIHNPHAWVDNDPVFVVGNGRNDDNRSDALFITKSGNVGIGMGSSKAPPEARLHVTGNTLTEGNSNVSGQLAVGGQAVFNQPVILQGAAVAGDIPMFGAP